MLKWFRRESSAHQTELAMIGPKSGDRMLAIGEPDPALVAELARAAGLNGQMSVAYREDTRRAFETAAAKAGALIDLVPLGQTDSSLVPSGVTGVDLVVLDVDLSSMALEVRVEAAREALRLLRGGGRLIAIDRPRRGLFGRGAPVMPPDAVVPMLTSVGAIAARALGTADNVTYYEARKAR